MEKYLFVIEKGKNNYSAFSPDILGCAATGKSVEETLLQIKETLQMHLEALSNDGEDIPRAKGISQHISDGVFNDGGISGEYFITDV